VPGARALLIQKRIRCVSGVELMILVHEWKYWCIATTVPDRSVSGVYAQWSMPLVPCNGSAPEAIVVKEVIALPAWEKRGGMLEGIFLVILC